MKYAVNCKRYSVRKFVLFLLQIKTYCTSHFLVQSQLSKVEVVGNTDPHYMAEEDQEGVVDCIEAAEEDEGVEEVFDMPEEVEADCMH